MLEAEEIGVARVAFFIFEIIKIQLAPHSPGKKITVFHPGAEPPGAVKIRAESGIHVSLHHPVKALAVGETLWPGKAELGHQEAGRPVLERIAQVREVEDGNLLYGKHRIPHLDMVVFLEVRPGEGKFPARHRLGAGSDVGFIEAVCPVVLPLDGFSLIADGRLEDAEDFFELSFGGIHVEVSLIAADRLIREEDRDIP